MSENRFERSVGGVARRLVVSVNSKSGHGKTHFGLTAPAIKKGKSHGLVVLNLDEGLEGTIQKFHDNKEVYISTYPTIFDPPKGADVGKKVWVEREAERVYKKFKEDLEDACSWARSVVIDTGTDLWELCRLAHFGQLSSPGENIGHWYAPVNADFKRMIRKAASSDANLIITHQMGDEWQSNKPTGNLKPSGFSKIENLVQVVVTISIDARGSHYVTIDKCRHDPSLMGLMVSGDTVDFATIASMIMPNSNQEDWL